MRLESCESRWLLYPESEEARAWLEEFTEGAERPYVVDAGSMAELVGFLTVVLAAGFTIR